MSEEKQANNGLDFNDNEMALKLGPINIRFGFNWDLNRNQVNANNNEITPEDNEGIGQQLAINPIEKSFEDLSPEFETYEQLNDKKDNIETSDGIPNLEENSLNRDDDKELVIDSSTEMTKESTEQSKTDVNEEIGPKVDNPVIYLHCIQSDALRVVEYIPLKPMTRVSESIGIIAKDDMFYIIEWMKPPKKRKFAQFDDSDESPRKMRRRISRKSNGCHIC